MTSLFARARIEVFWVSAMLVGILRTDFLGDDLIFITRKNILKVITLVVDIIMNLPHYKVLFMFAKQNKQIKKTFYGFFICHKKEEKAEEYLLHCIIDKSNHRDS